MSEGGARLRKARTSASYFFGEESGSGSLGGTEVLPYEMMEPAWLKAPVFLA